MAKIAVVTDSVATIPADLVKKYNIYVAPVHIIWDKVDYRDGVDLQTGEFYTRLRKSKTLPTTSSAIQGEFIQIFEALQGKVDGIVTLALTGALGAAYNSALNAKELVKGVPVEVIDTHTAFMAQGFGVIAAAKVAAAGGSISDVTKAAEKVIPNTHVFWAMDTLEYLRKGGRVSLPQAILASWLQVKPITGLNKDGKVEPLARVRTRAKVMDKLLDLMDERISGNTPLHVSVLHGDASEEAEKLEQKVNAKYKPVELIRSEISPVIGTHTGPGTLGLAFYNE
ncbi:MAG: DegV family protein [Dehalococcoidales bacterium]|nr:DegV family protein [Dehalococcoidales bacterium]